MRELGSENRLPFAPRRQQHRRHRRRLADAVRLHVGPDELHRVVDRQPGRDRPARAVDVEQDVLVGVLGLEEQHLRDDQVGDRVVDRRADEDDAVLQQAREDVVGALAAVGLLDHHRHQLHPGGCQLRCHRLRSASSVPRDSPGRDRLPCRKLGDKRRSVSGLRQDVAADYARAIVTRDSRNSTASLPPQSRSEPLQVACPSRAARARPRASAPCARRTPATSRSRSSSLTASCSRRATSSSTSVALHRLVGRLALVLAERLPVDPGLPRVDPLLDQAAGRTPRCGGRCRARPATSGTSKVTRAPSAFSRSLRSCRSASCGFCLASSSHLLAQLLERLDLAHFLREVVVERRHDPPADRPHLDRVLDLGAGQFLDRVVGRVVHAERLLVARVAAPSAARRTRAGSRPRRSRARRSRASRPCPAAPFSIGRRSRSTDTVSPCSTPRSSTGSNRAARWRSRSSAWSTAAGSTVAGWRRSWISA